MDEKRKGEIAIALLKYRISREGIRLSPGFTRELSNTARGTGVSQDELKEFARLLLEELIADFSK